MKETMAAEQIEREISRLRQDFERLPTVTCYLRIERNSIFSRSATRRAVPVERGSRKIEGCMSVGMGIEFPPKFIRTAEDANSAVVFYDRTGKPTISPTGTPLCIDPGIRSSHILFIQGSEAERNTALQAVKKASDWASKRWSELRELLFSSQLVLNNATLLWCDVVTATASIAESATLPPPTWFVQISETERMSVDAWHSRNDWESLTIDLAVEEAIGDDPEDCFCESETLLSDSLEVLDFLKRELCGTKKILTEAEDRISLAIAVRTLSG